MDVPFIERLDLYSAVVTYPDDCKPVQFNPLGLPRAPGRSQRSIKVAWEDLELVISLCIFDFGVVKTDKYIERYAQIRVEAMWAGEYLGTRAGIRKVLPRPVEPEWQFPPPSTKESA